VSQHTGLTLERWQSFSLDQRLLMIANEMHRAGRFQADADTASRWLAYERVLSLAQLTVEAGLRRPLLREFLRWRDLIAAMRVDEHGDAAAHGAALHALLLFTPVTAQQIPHIL
jgi:hypothetical protein